MPVHARRDLQPNALPVESWRPVKDRAAAKTGVVMHANASRKGEQLSPKSVQKNIATKLALEHFGFHCTIDIS